MLKTLLVGHRGTGKTALLARIERYHKSAGRDAICLDLDREIEKRAGRTIGEIFARDGELAFRALERATFEAIDFASMDSTSEVSRASNMLDISSTPLFLVAGAGFDPGLAPESWRVLWVRRATDAQGRVFTDRPRLNAAVGPLEEYLERRMVRDERFRARADETLWLDEGLDGCGEFDRCDESDELDEGRLNAIDPVDSGDAAERDFFLDTFVDLRAALTLRSEHFRGGSQTGHQWSHQAAAKFAEWLERRVRWGVRWFELRDDLLSEEQMERAVRLLPADRVLVSFRAPARQSVTERLITRHGLTFDWPLEMGPCVFGEPRYLSYHARAANESIEEALAHVSSAVPLMAGSSTQLKAALPVHNFRELMAGHEWMNQNPETRLFLPHSSDGRWSWYRLLQGSRYSLNFVREDEGSGADQPTLLQWARRRRMENLSGSGGMCSCFAAVLGDPVAHSRTPMEQGGFFARQAAAASVFAIRVTADEWRRGGGVGSPGALEILFSLGLRWAAVTAPLKELAFASCAHRDPVSEALGALNTLMWNEERGAWVGTNTDLEGFRQAIADIENGGDLKDPLERIAVWGGGGTLNVIKAVLPEAQLFSLRTGENRVAGGPSASEFQPDTVVWAVGRSRTEAGAASVSTGADISSPFTLPSNWAPKVVIDLNYADDSPGREYALTKGCRYVSGLTMFRHQAAAQRRFWWEFENKIKKVYKGNP